MKSFLIFLATMLVSGIAMADEFQVVDRLSDLVRTQCQRFYGLDAKSNRFIEDLKNATISETDKLACALPYTWAQIRVRLTDLERLDPLSPWQRRSYLTLAARIYNFDYLINTPHDGGTNLEIMAVHPDLLILHRILRQLTPYALALVYPQIGEKAQDFARQVRQASAGVTEVTPWSARLREANGVDCYGPFAGDCNKSRAESLEILRLAIALMAKNENLFGYVTQYSKTHEFAETSNNVAIQLTSQLRRALYGEAVDFILAPRLVNGWMSFRVDLRDTLNYLSHHNADVETSTNTVISLDNLSCKKIYESLFALASETDNVTQADLAPFNPMQPEANKNPHLMSDRLAFNTFIGAQDCKNIPQLSREFGYRGLLSRFLRYQAHIFLLGSHDDGQSASEEIKTASRSFALLTDIERVVQVVQEQARGLPEIKTNEVLNKKAQALVDYVTATLKEK